MTAIAHRRRIVAVFTAAMMLTTLGYTAAFADHDPADGPEVTPTLVLGNDTCDYKIEPPNAGTYVFDVEGVEVTIAITRVGETFTFVSSHPVETVVAKGGPDHNVYDYTGMVVYHDDGLVSPDNDGEPYGLSHISFCFSEPPLPSLVLEKEWEGHELSAEELADLEVTLFIDGEAAPQSVEYGGVVEITETVVGDLPEGCTYDSDAPFDYTVNAEDAVDGVITLTVTNTVVCEGEGSDELDLTVDKKWVGAVTGTLVSYEVTTGTVKTVKASTFQFGPGGYAGWSCGAGEMIVGASWTTEGEAIAWHGPVGPGYKIGENYTYGPDEYGYVLQNGPVGQEVNLTIECVVIEDIEVDEKLVTGLPSNCSYTSEITDVYLDEDEVVIELTNTVVCDTTTTTATTPTTLATTTTTVAVLGTTVTTMPTQVLGTTVSEVSADTLPFTGFEAGSTVLLAMLAMLAGGLTLFAVRGRKQEEGAVTDIGGWSNL